MTIWSRSSRTFIYYFLFATFFTTLFVVIFDLQEVFRSLDIICAGTRRIRELPRALACLYVFYKFIYSDDKFFGVIVNMYRVSKQDKWIEGMATSVGIDGEQRVGKTRKIVYFGMVLKDKKFEDLKFDYYLDCPFEKELQAKFDSGDRKRYIAFDCNRYSVEYYEAHPELIPLCVSNIDIIDKKGRKPLELHREHFTMDERLPQGNIKMLSEADKFLPNSLRRQKDSETDEQKANLIAEFVGLDAQMTGGTSFIDTHNDGAVFLPVRDCQQMVLHLLDKKSMYGPSFLIRIYKHYRKKVMKKKKKTSKHLSRICTKLKALIRSIGVTRNAYFPEVGPSKRRIINTDKPLYLYEFNQEPYEYNDTSLQDQYIPLGYRDKPTILSKYEKAFIQKNEAKEKLKELKKKHSKNAVEVNDD